MGWASDQFRRDLGIPPSEGYIPSKKEDLEESISKIENENQPVNRVDAEQAIVHWKYFDDNLPQRREPLKDCLQSLIDGGYHIDNVISTGNYQKTGSTTILITEAIIIISQ